MGDFRVCGAAADAPFALTLHRGEGMCLLAMNWRGGGQPPADFVGFAIEYREPGDDRFWPLNNRLSFTDASKITDKTQLSTLHSPIQKFRWIHFPVNAQLTGTFSYRVTPVFMDATGALSYGVPQTADVDLQRETYPGELDVGFTRNFISSQAFVDRYGGTSQDVATLLPPKATVGTGGLEFKATNPKAAEAYDWMGFEARAAILNILDQAIAAGADTQVRIVAYDFNEAEIFDRIKQLAGRVKIIIDNSGSHGPATSAETTAAALFVTALGADNVRREHCGTLQHNKFIVVDGPTLQKAVCGSTNFSWRGLYVQANNAVTLTGKSAIQPFLDVFEAYWAAGAATPFDMAGFRARGLGQWLPLGLPSIDAAVTFSPHAPANAMLASIAADIDTTQSSLLYSLAFLYQTHGVIEASIVKVRGTDGIFVYGISDHDDKALDVVTPSGNAGIVYPAALLGNLPPPFEDEPTGGAGVRMHHKFVVIDFNLPTARVYLGSYNFSESADNDNGENLLLIRDRRVATSYMVEALSLFDHYQFRIGMDASHATGQPIVLHKPPVAGEKPWFDDDYTVPYKIHDRELFAGLDEGH